jgi:glycosyltransferase involved in cell wall biosynthesis
MPEDRYRVLFVASHPVQYAAPIFRQMAQHPKLDIQVAYCSLQGAESGRDPEFGVEVKWDVPLLDGYPWVGVPNKSLRPGLGRFFGLLNPGLWRLVAAGNYDAVVVYTGYMCASFWIAAAAAKRHRIALLFGTDATSLEPRDRNRLKVRVKQWILPAIFRMATVALAPSAATADYLRNLRVPDDRIVITPFVVDNDYWTSRAVAVDRAAVRSAWGIPDRQSVVLFCAKLQPWKRPQDVLRAFAQANVPDASLIMAGDGPMRAELEAEASRLRIAGRVHFLGFVNQSKLPALYRSADVMVLPSEYDPCPVVVCEAMLCGCPVIVSDKIRGRLELVRSGDTGFIYPCGDVDALADTLQWALSDRRNLSQMSKAAGDRMKTWSPRENIEAHISAVRASAVPKRRNCSPEAPDLQPRLRS